MRQNFKENKGSKAPEESTQVQSLGNTGSSDAEGVKMAQDIGPAYASSQMDKNRSSNDSMI